MSEDDDLSLRPEALAALREFLAERDAAREREAREAEERTATLATSEDWQLSQFWYDEATGVALANEVLACARDRGGAGTTIALLSCPSTYKALLSVGIPDGVTVRIFEYDRRFACFGDAYVFYDFNQPLDFPAELVGACDVIMLDPPFINPDTLAGFAASVAALRRNDGAAVLLCTGSVMVPHAARLLRARPTRAHIGHSNRLSNPFTLYSSDEASAARMGGWDTEAEEAAASAEGQRPAAGGAGGNAGAVAGRQ
jgi:hypothetical protein